MHNFADAGALGAAIFARWLGRRAPTPRHTYGFKRAEILAALLNAAALLAISMLIGRAAFGRLFHPEMVQSSVMLVAALIALAANLASVGLLKSHSREDINVRSAFLHLMQDALASGAVFAAALLTRTGIGASGLGALSRCPPAPHPCLGGGARAAGTYGPHEDQRRECCRR